MINKKLSFPVWESDPKCAIFAQKREKKTKFPKFGFYFSNKGVCVPVLLQNSNWNAGRGMFNIKFSFPVGRSDPKCAIFGQKRVK